MELRGIHFRISLSCFVSMDVLVNAKHIEGNIL